ncbi:MAG: bifunctional (p)ppGpp synthetase/guanosine-3',5'-bis(diphosphate) 3'-pyrophosphohydrolase [Oscillospiraceae bacterium]|jgi:GTP pyrophosphokinase|nr:bifunctional (p)ppGpp synthetase/guanosine-3',5'-bis(diphosphate) 3'-pyrophosphohydrolase [Oscillospiraceae bacterium]
MNENKNAAVAAGFNRLADAVHGYNPGANIDLLRAAFEFADSHHEGQKRKEGSPYITHPLATAQIIAEMGLDDESLAAALLHDCIEDTPATREEITKLFGEEVADIVDGVTKLTRVQYTSKEEEQMENLRKMLMAMARDIRVILIKIADRLHNMRTMEYQTPEKQREKSLETLEVYAPIAHRLGMQRVKWELEDLSLRYLEPDAYDEIARGVANRERENAGFFTSTADNIRDRLRNGNCDCEVYGRVKHIYSIYRKMAEQQKTFQEILDLYAFRVVVESVAECFHALGHIHEIYTPIPGRFKDYITIPKPNGYQSLHTTVIGSNGIPFEVQIRTEEMHRIAEYGVAAHWKYKSGTSRATSDEEKYAWIRRILESQQDTDPEDFFQALRTDMFADEVFALTPKGDVKSMPAGATPIDFAYAIHSAVGNRMTGAIVNGRIVPFPTQLQNGDIVEILTSNSSKGPSRDWLNIVRSAEARNKIRQWFKKEKREENIVHGKVAFEGELRRAGIQLSEITHEDVRQKVLRRLAFPSMDDLYAAIGYGGVSSQKCVNKIRDEVLVSLRTKKKDEPPETAAPAVRRKAKPVNGVIVEDLENCLVKFARCCTPVPGDPIVGFVTRGFGVSVHRGDCVNYRRSMADPDESGRWISVSWANSESDTFQTALAIISNRTDGIVLDVAGVLSALKVHMVSINARDLGGKASVAVTVEVKNTDELTALLARLHQIDGVSDVRRSENA